MRRLEVGTPPDPQVLNPKTLPLPPPRRPSGLEPHTLPHAPPPHHQDLNPAPCPPRPLPPDPGPCCGSRQGAGVPGLQARLHPVHRVDGAEGQQGALHIRAQRSQGAGSSEGGGAGPSRASTIPSVEGGGGRGQPWAEPGGLGQGGWARGAGAGGLGQGQGQGQGLGQEGQGGWGCCLFRWSG